MTVQDEEEQSRARVARVAREAFAELSPQVRRMRLAMDKLEDAGLTPAQAREIVTLCAAGLKAEPEPSPCAEFEKEMARAEAEVRRVPPPPPHPLDTFGEILSAAMPLITGLGGLFIGLASKPKPRTWREKLDAILDIVLERN